MIERSIEINQSECDVKRVNKAISYACRLLGVREYSQKMVADKLLSKGYRHQEIQQVISFLLENNWLSDQRFCESYIRFKSNKGIGENRIRFELKQKGLSNELIMNSFEALNIDWQNNCNEVCKKKLKGLKGNSIKEYQKLERFLKYRGFSAIEVKDSMNQCFVMGVISGEHDE